MKISEEEVSKVANLARLELRPEEVKSLTGQLDSILSYIEKLNELDTEGISPTTHAIAINNAFREDVVQESLPQQDAIANGPVENGEAFVVPRII